MKKLEFAQLFRTMGIAVIPLRHRGKEPASHMMGGTWEKYKTTLPAEYDVMNWLYSDWHNYGVVAGWGNLAMIDFDDQQAYEIWKAYFVTLRGLYGSPFIVRSARGAHVYIRLFGNYANQKRRGVDVKVHGYCVGPGSVHPSGAIYTAENFNFEFPEVYDLDTLIPTELFPHVAAAPCEAPVQLDFTPARKAVAYDPFEVANSASGVALGLDIVTKVKQAVRIENMFSERVQTSGDGRWWAVKCLFHDDKSPSAWIDTRMQLYGCQVCNMKPMDAINLYSRQHGVVDSVAVRMMAAEMGVL
ncbi:MAG: bifunctional DNA primase/polymerase [Chloroflexi bacterium]|nr:bifunctional DNA primase/polymerase [Chloroflexota bacterium]